MKQIFGFSRHDERPNCAPRWLLRLLTWVLMTMVATTPAHAHALLKSSVPASGAHLGVAPRQLRLDFSESLELTFTTIILRDQTGAVVALGPVQGASDSRRAVLVSVRGALAAGTFTVEWKSAGADGHPVQGKFDFTIAPGAQGLGPLPAGSGQDRPVLRRIQRSETGLDASLGQRAASVGLAGVVVVGTAVLLRLYAQSYAMHGAARALDRGLVASMLTTTTWGRGWLLQLVGVGVALGGFWGARRGSRRGWMVAGFGVLALAFSPAFSGHAASAPQLTALAILADGLHVIGAGGWLGSLLIVLVVGIPAALRLEESARHRAVADLINAFSPTALAFAGLTAATGVFAAWIHLGQVSALWQTTYGKTLLVKLAILSVVACTGAYNWRRVKPALGSPTGTVRIRKSARLEVAVGVLVILVTAVLVATPIEMDAGAMHDMNGMTAAPDNP
jgi:copper transport protein